MLKLNSIFMMKKLDQANINKNYIIIYVNDLQAE